jgi:hypothetical protein
MAAERTYDPKRGLTSSPQHPVVAVQRTRFTGRIAAPPMMAQMPATANSTL